MENSKEKQIEEMAKAIYGQSPCVTIYKYNCKCLATGLYTAGYRKSSDVAEEIFAEIEDALEPHIESFTKFHITQKIAELKKKYTEKEGD